MALTIITAPQKYTPAYNPVILQVATDNSNIVYFTANVLSSGATIANLKIYPTPSNPLGAYLNLSNILQGGVKTTLKKNDNIIEALPNDTFKYDVRLTENNISGVSVVTGSTVTVSGKTVFNGVTPTINYNSYDYQDYVINTATNAKFLTDKPDKSSIKFWSTEYLYFINDYDTDIKASINLHYKDNVTSGYTFDVTNFGMNRVNISPRTLTANNIEVQDLIAIEVVLTDSEGVEISEKKTFISDRFKCNSKPVNLVWVNDLGGVDSYTFQNPRQQLTVEKQTIKTNNYSIQNGTYTNEVNNIILHDERIISSASKSVYTVVSDWLTNDEYAWIVGIIKSKTVYVELTNGKLLPVKIQDNSIQIQNSKYSKTPLQFELKYECESGLNIGWEETNQFPNRVGQIGFNYPLGILNQTYGFEYVNGNTNNEVIL